jgi:mitochondrial fission protein ELM1
MSELRPGTAAAEAERPEQRDPEHPPRVWLLLDDRPGHRTQVIGLAERLGWPSEIKHLSFGPLNRISNRLLGASRLAVRTGRSSPLEPPWPDLVIAMGRRTAPVARWIKRQSGGRTRLVQLGRKGANAADGFDLAVTCRHFQLPDHPNRLQILLPPTQVTAARLRDAAARWPDLMAAAKAPRVVLLVGGTTAHHRLTPESADSMAVAVQAFADARGGSLTCVTSRRTGTAVEAALRHAVPRAEIHCWRADREENPYLGYLARADILVVTGDSESMLAEAATTQKPLVIHPVTPRPESWHTRLAGRVLAGSRGAGALARWCTALIQRGWVVPPRDLAIMHRGMVESGQAVRFDGSAAVGAAVRRALPEEDMLVTRVRALLDPARTGHR